MIDKELWKDVPNYEGIYEASTYGRIRTKDGKTTFDNRHGLRHWHSRIMKYRGHSAAGHRVSLWINGTHKDWLVARLIAITFLGVPQVEMTVNHMDGNRLNNNIKNLEWLTREDNIRHAFKTGLMSFQIGIKLISDSGTEYQFRSMAQASLYLGRNKRYISAQVKRKQSISDTNGHKYSCILLNVA